MLSRSRYYARGMASFMRGLGARAHVEARAELLLDAYRRRRERYDAAARARGLLYRPERVMERTRDRLQRVGVEVRRRSQSEPVHTLGYVPMHSWHAQLLPPIAAMGHLSNYDYTAHGLDYWKLLEHDPAAFAARKRVGEELEAYARQVSRERPVDMIFVYATGLEILAPTLARVREITGAPIVTMCLDDKQSWETDELYGGHPAGQIGLASVSDLAWTSARVACEWYMVEGSNPIFLAEGGSPSLFAPAPDGQEQDLDACFIGQCYGFRGRFIGELRRAGVAVEAFGPGWPNGRLADDQMVTTMQRSRVILGLGGIGWSEQLKNVKGRDFDAPLVGAYATSHNPDLAPFFSIGHEIATFSNVDEAVDVLRELVRDDDRRAALREAGRRRCLREHTWEARFRQIARTLGIHEPTAQDGEIQ
jgi:spore maturation protein CgeB